MDRLTTLAAAALLMCACIDIPAFESPADPDASADTASTDTSSADTSSTDAATPAGTVPTSDEFDNPGAQGDWHILDGSAATVSFGDTDAGHLTVVPVAGASWYNAEHGAFVYKAVAGDFLVQTSVIAGTVDDHDATPTHDYQAAGLMLRDPAPVVAGDRWVLIDAGHQGGDNELAVKNTEGSLTQKTESDGTNMETLALCKTGGAVILLRKVGGDWTELTRYSAPGGDHMMQVGVMASAYQNNAELYARFDYVRFGDVDAEADCFEDL